MSAYQERADALMRELAPCSYRADLLPVCRGASHEQLACALARLLLRTIRSAAAGDEDARHDAIEAMADAKLYLWLDQLAPDPDHAA